MTLHGEHPRYDETNMPASQPIAMIGWVADCKDGAQEQARAIARARKEALRAAVVLSCLPALCGVSIDCPALPCPALAKRKSSRPVSMTQTEGKWFSIPVCLGSITTTTWKF